MVTPQIKTKLFTGKMSIRNINVFHDEYIWRVRNLCMKSIQIRWTGNVAYMRAYETFV